MRLLPFLLLPTLALAHQDDTPAPGEEHTHAIRTGNGQWTYELVPGWGELPDGKPIGPTHGGVVVDPQDGRVYNSTDAEHAILVFEKDGAFVGNIAPECSGFHAMEIRVEDGKTMIYGAQLGGPNPLRVCKLDTEGKLLLTISADRYPELEGGWKGLTSVAVAPDGSIFCSMGYGSQMIHKFDASGRHLKTFGGRGTGQQVLTKTSHGLKVDLRYDEPRLLVCDRGSNRIFHTTLEGEWIGEYATHLRRPCSVSIEGDFCAVAELQGRVTILDKDGTPVAFVGDNPDESQWANFKVAPEDMKPALFTAPHGCSFDADFNLYVQDWNRTGRLTKLRKIH